MAASSTSFVTSSLLSNITSLLESNNINKNNNDNCKTSTTTNNNTTTSSSIRTILPTVLQYSFTNKCSIYNIQNYISMIITLDGRDKLTKLLQYISRFLSWYYMSLSVSSSSTNDSHISKYYFHHGQRFASIKSNLTTSRKAFRLGRTFIELYKIYTMKSIIYKSLSTYNNTTNNNPYWKVIGTTIKLLSLSGYWLGDNINYLSMIGLFDNYTIDNKSNTILQKQLQTSSSLFSNQCYFIGALSGFYVNVHTYIHYLLNIVYPIEQELILLLQNQQQHEQEQNMIERKQQQQQSPSSSRSSGSNDTSDPDYDVIACNTMTDPTTSATSTVATTTVQEPVKSVVPTTTAATTTSKSTEDIITKKYKQIKEEQFNLLLVTIKSFVDVLVFSNNPGIDLWYKHTGYKLYEPIHCICGILSACTVLYTNFPNINNQ